MGIYLSSKLLRNEEYYEKQVNYIEIAKETVILTAAVAVIAAAVYFFWCQAMRQSAVFPVLESCFLILFHCRYRQSP